jgi:hypothetical protein
VVDILGELYISTFVLVFLISEKTYKEISQHEQDKTYVRTSAVEKAMQFLHEHGVVILYGNLIYNYLYNQYLSTLKL